jgi:lysophospholipase L1-like esterase
MPYLHSTFVYDFKTFEKIKSDLNDSKFFHIFDAFYYARETEYTDKDGYLHYQYLHNDEKEKDEDAKDFDYTLNSDLFRGKHFSTLSNENYNVVALGCSYTFGFGIPEQYTWPKILEDSIKKNKPNVKMHNLGSPGLGVDSIINNFLTFVSKYGTPNAIFALLPDINRHILYHPDEEKYITYTPSLISVENKKRDRHLFNVIQAYRFEDRAYQAINQIKMLELLCKGFGIKLFWHAWKPDDIDLYEKLKFNNYINVSNFSGELGNGFVKINEKYKKYSHYARDGIHPGIDYSAFTAEMFLKVWRASD